MAQLLDYLMSALNGIWDWISMMVSYFGNIIIFTIRSLRFAGVMFGTLVNLPGYFSWLPEACISLLISIFTFIVAIKIIKLIP